MPYRNPGVNWRESITFKFYRGQNNLPHCVEMLHRFKNSSVGYVMTLQSRLFYPSVIPADNKIAGYLPAPKDAVAQKESTPEQLDLASGLFGMQIQVAEPVKTQPKPQAPAQKQTPKPANKSAKVLKFPYTKSLYVNEKLVKNVDCVREYANRYEFMYTGNVVYTISKGEVNTVAGNSISIFISTK